MEITVSRDELHAAVTWAVRNLPSRPVLPVLMGIRLEAAAGRLTVSVFDYEVSARVTVPAVFTDADGVALVGGKQLGTAVKSLPKKPAKPGGRLLVTLTALDGGGVEIACEDTMSSVTGLPLDEYPGLPEVPEPFGMLDAQALRQAAARVVVAAGKDDTLPVLTCMCLEPGAESLTLAATDRYRYTHDSPEWTALRADMPGHRYLVPARTVAAFAKDSDGKVTVAFDDTAHDGGRGGIAAFSDDTRTLTVRTMSGAFPRDYRKKFSQSEHATEIVVDSDGLAAAVKACGEMTSGKAVRLIITEGQARIEAVHEDGATAAHRVIPALLTGDELTIWFDPAYLAPMAAVMKGPMRLAFTSPVKPAEITAATGSYWAILVPMREPETSKPEPAPKSAETAEAAAE